MKKEAEKLKLDLDEELERYYEIKKAIEDNEKALDRLGKAKDRAYGPNKLKYIEAEIKE